MPSAWAPDMNSGDVLSAFHRDAPYLFLGAGFVAVGFVSAAFTALRRRRDSLRIFFSLFAVLYGLRLWISSALLGMTVRSAMFQTRVRPAINYLILIPAFLFFLALGLPRRFERVVGLAMVGLGGILATATLLFGNSITYERINSISVIGATGFFLVRFMMDSSAERGSSAALDFAVVRWGLLIFVASVVWENITGLLARSSHKMEPVGFAMFLATLGYVAARRALQRDQQLNEIQKELDVARRIQLSILPPDFPKSAHFRVAARYQPMTAVAGDFYYYVVADDHQAGLLVGDVSGHGIPAALIASMVKLAVASQLAFADEPSRFLSGMNSALVGNTQHQFVTAAYVHLNAESRELRYSAGGHPPMLLLRNGGVTEIEQNGLMLAAFDFASYSNATYHLEAGDRLLLYTDGILDACNSSGDFFGKEGLHGVFQGTAGLPAAAAADSIIASVRNWSMKQEDDLTVLVCDYF